MLLTRKAGMSTMGLREKLRSHYSWLSRYHHTEKRPAAKKPDAKEPGCKFMGSQENYLLNLASLQRDEEYAT